MKYLKITITVFAITLCLAVFGVNAREYTQLIDITIPSWSGSFISKQVNKDDDWIYTQKVKKTAAKDNLSGDGRAISGKIKGMFQGMITTGWKKLPQGSNINFGSGTEVVVHIRLKEVDNNKITMTYSALLFIRRNYYEISKKKINIYY